MHGPEVRSRVPDTRDLGVHKNHGSRMPRTEEGGRTRGGIRRKGSGGEWSGGEGERGEA